MQGTPTQEVWILHLLESFFNVILGAVGQHNLLVGPIGVVGEQEGLAQLHATEPLQCCLVGRETEFQAAARGVEFALEQRLEVLDRADRANLILHPLACGLLAFAFFFSPTAELALQSRSLRRALFRLRVRPCSWPSNRCGLKLTTTVCIRPNTFFCVRKTSTPPNRGLSKARKRRRGTASKSLCWLGTSEPTKWKGLLARVSKLSSLLLPLSKIRVMCWQVLVSSR